MHSFECALEVLPHEGVDFVIRRATHLPQGETAAGRSADAPKLPKNPFLAPDPALVVDTVSDTHVALLNKFSVLREHLLVVTRTFVEQRTPLDEADFDAISRCMTGADVLAFFNGGPDAGASQKHKHMQLVTLPLSPREAVPMAALLQPGGPRPPFTHAYMPLAPEDLALPRELLDKYLAAMAAARVGDGPYNMVLTREGMLIVPRARDKFEDVSINALAFAGSFFVRDRAHQEAIVRAGPMNVLRHVVS